MAHWLPLGEKDRQAMGAMGDPSLASFSVPVHGHLELSSVFQPIFSPAHRRAVGFEGLIRARDKRGRIVPPLELFSEVPLGESRVLLDRQCRSLHVSNFVRCGDRNSWLFLNVDPYVAVEGRTYGSFFASMLEEAGLPPHRVAVELIESPLADESRLAAAMQYYRELGCVIVLDDFGAGYSNFDRIWRLHPDIVKIDREMTRRVSVEPLARRMFGGIVSVLHEAGALVCVEGIETETEALCAAEANADLLQGHYFASPSSGLPPADVCRETFAGLHAGFRAESLELQARREARLDPYLRALTEAGRALSRGDGHGAAAGPLLALPCTQRCYLIAGDGTQVGGNLESEHNASARDLRLEPMLPSPGTNWQNKPYFRRAVSSPGVIQVTRPYLSVTGPKVCLTLSLACEVDGKNYVICADLDHEALEGDSRALPAS
jgi:EAL domain-containing protein (putative c-di-GMP-specific phosphodiesterase class I)